MRIIALLLLTLGSVLAIVSLFQYGYTPFSLTPLTMYSYPLQLTGLLCFYIYNPNLFKYFISARFLRKS